jgi:DEAD/DEAH box helicase domain-containing protein
MNTRILHDEAMALTDQALVAQRRGDEAEARWFFSRALELETQAAESVPVAVEAEPTRSILFRSAATLALRCGMVEAATTLAQAGLEGDPPASIAAELRTLADATGGRRQDTESLASALSGFLREAEWSIEYEILLPGRGARTFRYDFEITPAGLKYLTSRFPAGIYEHQLLALRKYFVGDNVCLATGTSSGKSMVFYASAIEHLARHPKATVLFVYPLKALAREQEVRIKDAIQRAGMDVGIARIDGQVAGSTRARLIREARILIATPDVLHAWLLASLEETAVRRFLKNLGLVVVDEVHSYTGVFGSNAAFLFRRLEYAVRALGGRFSYISASATIANPQTHLGNLFGADFSLILPESDSSPRQDVKILLVTPPRVGDLLSNLTDLLKYLASKEAHRFIAFVDSRKQVEYLSAIMQRSDDRSEEDSFRTDHLESMNVLPFRAGYELEDLNTIQSRMSSGRMHGVISTSALELGIDIPHLDTGVLVGVPPSRTSLLQRIGRIGRHKPGIVLVINRGDLQDQQAFREASSFMDRPLTESSLYLHNTRIQYLHALCLARIGGEHDVLLGDASTSSGELNSQVNWPTGFLELCAKERIGEIPPDLQSMKMEGGETPNRVFPLRDVESQFKIECKQGPDLRPLGSLSHTQVLREAYPGAVYYYTGQPFRVYRVYEQTKLIWVRKEGSFTTKPINLPTLVFPNLSLGNVHAAIRLGELTVVDCNVQIREIIVGFKERRGPNEISVSYPLSLLTGGIRFDPPRFTRNYFTTGLIFTHPALSRAGVRGEICARMLYEGFLSLIPFERQDLGSASDRHRSDRDPFSSGQVFVAVHDQTYGSLRLSSRILEEGLLLRLLQNTRSLVDASDLRETEPATALALDEITLETDAEPKAFNIEGAVTVADQIQKGSIKVIMPDSRGLDIRRDNKEFAVAKVFFSPTLQSVAYRGRYETTSDPQVVEIVSVDSLVPISGESRLGFYDLETGDLVDGGVAP